MDSNPETTTGPRRGVCSSAQRKRSVGRIQGGNGSVPAAPVPATREELGVRPLLEGVPGAEPRNWASDFSLPGVRRVLLARGEMPSGVPVPAAARSLALGVRIRPGVEEPAGRMWSRWV